MMMFMMMISSTEETEASAVVLFCETVNQLLKLQMSWSHKILKLSQKQKIKFCQEMKSFDCIWRLHERSENFE